MIHVQTQCITSKPLLFFKMNAHMLSWQLKSLSAALIELSQQYMVNAIEVHQTCVRNLPRTPAAFKKNNQNDLQSSVLFQQTQAKGILLSLPIRGATRQKIKCRPQTRPLLSFPVISSFGTESRFFHWFTKKKVKAAVLGATGTRSVSLHLPAATLHALTNINTAAEN